MPRKASPQPSPNGHAQSSGEVAAAVLAADGIGAAEAVFDVVTELVRDHRLVELVRIARALAKSPRM
jgi:hypothetical protein